MTYNKIKFGVGIFVILIFINIFFFLYYILDEKGVFDDRYDYHFTTYTAEPFNIGMPIKVSGFKIGYVEKIKLKDNGNVEVTFSVNSENQKWVLENSVIMIQKPLLGSSQVVLYPAIGNDILQEDSAIEVYESSDINDVIYKLQPIVEKIENIVTSVDKITTYLAREDSEVVNIVKNIEKLSSRLVENKSILTTITGDQNATDSLIQSINQLPVLMNNINNLSSDVRKDIMPQIAQFAKELTNIVKDVKSKLERLDGVVNSVSSYENDITYIKDDITNAVAKSKELLEKVDSLLIDEDKNEVKLP